MSPRLHPALLAALARGETLLAPNQRIARALQTAYAAHQLSQDLPLWTAPRILPLESFLADRWLQTVLAGDDQRSLITFTQEAALWREVLQSDPETPHLHSAESLATLAARAFQLLHLYQGSDRLNQFPPSTDSRAFARWLRAFTRRLNRASLITAAELPSALAPVTTPITLVDFDTLPPALAALFPTAAHLQTATHTPSPTLLTTPDDPAELQAAALWLKQHLANNPQGQIAVVVPDLATRRALIDRAFAPILQPESLPITAPATAPLYEFSLGRALTELPLAHAALDLLTWPTSPLPIDRISALLLNPWFLPTTAALAEFDAHELRRTPLLRPELSLARTLQLAERSPRRSALTPLISQLRALKDAAPTTSLRQPHAAWAEAFAATLHAARWSYSIAQSSLKFQQIRRFHAALDELAALDAIANLQPPSAPEALTALRRILAQTVFAPESRNAPIQIMGPLEVGGIPFDAILFLSADDLTWPIRPTPNPLLPWSLQLALSIPGTDHASDDTAARALTTRIARSAPMVTFSYALNSDEGPRRPSPVVAALCTSGETFIPPPIRTPLPLEIVPDDTHLPPLPNRTVPGGSRVLQLQAACPFRAFAEIRLASNQPEPTSLGLDPRDRGSLVHRVMEEFWTAIPSQSALRQLAATDLAHHLTSAIDRTFQRLRHPAESPWDLAYLRIQRLRLATLLLPWFRIELLRPPFTVLAPEQRRHVQLGPIALDLRIDRIDSTDQGLVLFDYKTSDLTPSAWLTPRPDEPQLPLYATLLAQESDTPIAAVAFAILRPGSEMKSAGFADDPTLIGTARATPMAEPTLPEQIEAWHATLLALAEDFAAGITTVDPKRYPETCTFCAQRPLCRINPTTLEDLESDPAQSPYALS